MTTESETTQREPADEPGYPFSAIVGQDRLRLALILCAVHPAIGGVLIRGEKGTAKSTVVRALATLLPTTEGPARLVELPIGATEDRVVGSIDLEKVLREGEQVFAPGLLAAAHNGVLYVDEVNLLHDHLVDVLLDAAAMGRVHVERDGVSHSHAARFVLVGTMNPEEGELRPQLLDRFGLAVDVAASREVDTRVEVIRRRMNYERDPHGFAANYAAAEAQTAQHIAEARERVVTVGLSDIELRRIAALCAAFDVDGMRADLVIARTAIAHAAWRGADEVTADDVKIAAELALPHRRRRDPFDEPGLDQDQLEQALSDAADAAESGPESQSQSASDRDPEPDPEPPNDSPDGGPGGGQGSAPSGKLDTNGSSSAVKRLQVNGIGEGAAGRRSRARTMQGRFVRAASESGHGLHVLSTLLEAARRGARPPQLLRSDLRGAYREGREGNLIVFAVDASGSMAARDRISAVSDAIVSLLRDAYQRRDKVAVVAFRGTEASVVLPPTSSVDIAVRRLNGVSTGGKTPLAEGLLAARDIVVRERSRDPHRRPLVIILTDGRATGVSAVEKSYAAAQLLTRHSEAVVVDCERGFVRLGMAGALANRLDAQLLSLQDLSAATRRGVQAA